MRRFISYGFIFLMGLVISFLYFKNAKSDRGSTQIAVIENGIRNVSKLVVTEASYSEVYSYNDIDQYFFETLDFEKKLTLLVNAKVQVSYNLKELETELDSLNKKLIITYVPEAVVTIIPEVKYYDFQQSVLNTFTKNDLNEIQQKAIDKLMDTVEISTSKDLAKDRLLEELEQLLSITKIVGWTIEDRTQDNFIKDLNLPMKD